MLKIFFLIFLLALSSCYKFKETNQLAIPPISRDEIKITVPKK